MRKFWFIAFMMLNDIVCQCVQHTAQFVQSKWLLQFSNSKQFFVISYFPYLKSIYLFKLLLITIRHPQSFTTIQISDSFAFIILIFCIWLQIVGYHFLFIFYAPFDLIPSFWKLFFIIIYLLLAIEQSCSDYGFGAINDLFRFVTET